jgi:transcriptional regulator with XRE-family HTH domain
MSRSADTATVDDQQLGIALRAMRTRRGWRQEDLARAAKVSRQAVGRIERGRVASIAVATVRQVADALDGRLDLAVRWHGGDLGRLVSARHAAMHEAMAGQLRSLSGWVFEPEVSFSYYGERGVIDILGWHARTRTVLVTELKTEFVDINETMGTLDRKGRLAGVIARDRGWQAAVTSVWLVMAGGRTNRRALAAHASVLRAKFPTDGRTIRGWLARPVGSVRALSFLPDDAVVNLRRGQGGTRRVVRVRPTKNPS